MSTPQAPSSSSFSSTPPPRRPAVRRRVLAAGTAIVVAGIGLAAWAGVSGASGQPQSHPTAPSTLSPPGWRGVDQPGRSVPAHVRSGRSRPNHRTGRQLFRRPYQAVERADGCSGCPQQAILGFGRSDEGRVIRGEDSADPGQGETILVRGHRPGPLPWPGHFRPHLCTRDAADGQQLRRRYREDRCEIGEIVDPARRGGRCPVGQAAGVASGQAGGLGISRDLA